VLGRSLNNVNLQHNGRTEAQIDAAFRYTRNPLAQEDVSKKTRILEMEQLSHNMSIGITKECQPGRYTQLALTAIEEANMWARKAIESEAYSTR
jgi:hypothetical protein